MKLSNRTANSAALVVALLASLAATMPSQAACFARGRLLFSGTGPWTVLMETVSGQACQQGILSDGTPQDGIIAPSESGRFKSLHAISEPGNGRLDLFQGGRFAYTSKAGYSGRDQFTLRLCQFYQAGERCTLAAVYVTVR